MSQTLPYDEIKFEKDTCVEEIENTPYDNDIGYFKEVDFKYPDNKKKKTKKFPFCPEIYFIPKDKYNDYMKKTRPKNSTKSKKLICEWTGKKKYLIQYRMFKFHARHGMVVKKFHEVTSSKQSKWLKKYMSLNTQKRNRAKRIFRETSIKYLLMLLLVKF